MIALVILILGLTATGLWAYVILDDLFDFSEPLSEGERDKILKKNYE